MNTNGYFEETLEQIEGSDQLNEEPKIDGVILGDICGLDDHGNPIVIFETNEFSEPIGAVSTVSVSMNDIGRAVALQFVDGDISRPIILGFIWQPIEQQKSDAIHVSSDDERVIITGKKEIVLKCGSASITLTRSGKILLKGKFLSSRSSGVNRIKGGSIQIN